MWGRPGGLQAFSPSLRTAKGRGEKTTRKIWKSRLTKMTKLVLSCLFKSRMVVTIRNSEITLMAQNADSNQHTPGCFRSSWKSEDWNPSAHFSSQ